MTRWILASLALIAAGGAGSYGAYQFVNAGPPVILPAPMHLAATAHTGQLLPGGWTNDRQIVLSGQSRKGIQAGADVEVRPVDVKFKGVPDAAISETSGGTDPSVSVRLASGNYHWQIRLHNRKGISPWRLYKGTINIDTRPPSAPRVSSPTDPVPGTTYHQSTLRFEWQASDAGAGIAGYSYRLDSDAQGIAATELRTQATGVSLSALNTGTYYFHVRALDKAGNWGPVATFPVKIDVTPPGLAHVSFSRFQFNPQFNTLRTSFQVTRPATKVRVGIYHNGSLIRLYALDGVPAGHYAAVTWDGKDDRGRLVAAGSYDLYIRAIDKYGHSSLRGWRDFGVNYHHIVISLSQEKLIAYDGSKVFLTSLVTTGNPALPTPAGTYSIMAKFHPFTFRSPWPKSSKFYYAPSPVRYAMLFRAGGYFIHDAPWRSVFGPGSNADFGTPGTNYTGSHGCVNVPSNVILKLYDWSPIGTVVQVVR